MSAKYSIRSAVSLLLWVAAIVVVTAFYPVEAKNANRIPPYQEWPSTVSYQNEQMVVRRYIDNYATNPAVIKDVDDVVCEYQGKEVGAPIQMLVWIRVPSNGGDIIVRLYDREGGAWVLAFVGSVKQSPESVAIVMACKP